MSLEFFIINPHLVPFFILFIIGAVLLILAPLHYRWRTKRIPVFLISKDFQKYNKFQRRALFLGITLVIAGIIGAALISEEYGYNRVVFDIHGNKSIEGSKQEQPIFFNKAEKVKSSEVVAGMTIIPGTWDWDIEKDDIGGNGKVDLWWSHVNETERYLAPRNGAKLSIISKISFDKIDEPYLNSLEFNENKISGSDQNPLLLPGTIIALLTAEGNLAKLKIVGFRALHDLAFKEAEDLPAEWRELVVKKPNIGKYHLEIEWMLFKRTAS